MNASGRIDEEKQAAIEERLGHTDLVCCACDVRNPSDADKCRSCGHTSLRSKSSEYRDA